jgi:hypothetical protein
MKGTLIMALVALMTMGSFTLSTPVPHAASAQTVLPVTQDGLDMTPQQTEFVQWAMTQGGVTLVLLVLMWSYRRDFKGILNRSTDENQELRYLLKENAAAATATALAIAQNTNATNNLANVIQVMDRRKGEP